MILNNQTFVMLTQAFSAAFDRGFKGFGVDQDWSRVASLENSGTKTGIYPYLGHFTKLREWIGDRQTQNFTQYGYQLVNRKFEATEEVQRTDIEDDQYGVYATAFQNAGASVKVWPDDLVYGGDTRYNFQSQTGVLGGAVMEGTVNACYDGQPFFSLNHPMGSGVAANYDNTAGTVGGGNPNSNFWMLIDNSKPIMPFIFQLRSAPKITARMLDTDPAVFDKDVFTWGIRARGAAGYGFWQLAFGSTADMTVANFRAYRAIMEGLTSDAGYKLGVTPKLLVCGPSLKSSARDLLKRQLIPSGTGMASNAEYEAVDLLVTTHLT